MGQLQRPLAQLQEVVRIRETSELRARSVWRDIVYRHLEDRHLIVLSVEEKTLKAALERAQSDIEDALRQL